MGGNNVPFALISRAPDLTTGGIEPENGKAAPPDTSPGDAFRPLGFARMCEIRAAFGLAENSNANRMPARMVNRGAVAELWVREPIDRSGIAENDP